MVYGGRYSIEEGLRGEMAEVWQYVSLCLFVHGISLLQVHENLSLPVFESHEYLFSEY